MTKIKVFGVVGAIVAVVAVVAGGGFIAVRYYSPKKPALSSQTTQITPTDSAAQTPSSLKVITNDNMNSATQAAGTQQSFNGAPANSNANGGGAIPNNPFDPTTFAQYEKYKDSKGALFGDVVVGTGAALEANQKAVVFYKGWLTNGTVFDESRPGSDGKLTPFTFTLGAHQVIPGLEEGVTGMKVGGVRLVIIPSALGYGAKGQGPIPPNSILIFQVQLENVQ